VPPFERSEYLERAAKTKQRMEAAGIEVLVAADPSNLCYLTGYDALSYYTPQVVILALDEEEPYWLGRYQDIPCARYTVFMDEDHIAAYPEKYIGDPDLHPMAYVADWLRDRGWGSRRLGVEMDNMCFTPRALQEMERGLPNAAFIDASLLVNWVRVVKSAQEVEYIRQASEIAASAMNAGLEKIAVGVRECDVAATIYGAMVGGTDQYGGAMPKGLTIATGPRTAAPHLFWTDEPFKLGDPVTFELGGCRNRYNAGLARTVFLGEPPKKLTDLVPVVVEGMHAAFQAAVPGALCQDVEAAWRAVINRHGYEKVSRIGYSIGIGYPGVGWVERTASLKQGDTTVLEPNMTFHMILGMWMDDWGFELSETFRISESGGPEIFNHVPQELFIRE
jgi:Xaa-Pro dipeptidase